MRVGELIEELQRFDPMQTVYVPDQEDGHFTKTAEVRQLFGGGHGVGLPEEGYFSATNIIGIVPVVVGGSEEP